MRYALSLLLIANMIATPAFAEVRGTRPKVSPELRQCFDSCKKEKDATVHETCMLKCNADFPMTPVPSPGAERKK